MNFEKENNQTREYFKKDFSQVNILMKKIRQSLFSGEKIEISDINLSGILDFQKEITFTYITLFQEGQSPIRWGSCRQALKETLDRNIEKIRENRNFSAFDINSPERCRILLEYVTEEIPARIEDINTFQFTPTRFEPGVTGIKIVTDGSKYYYMPTDAWVNSQMSRNQALNTILRKTRFGKLTNKISERIMLFKSSDYEAFIIKSRAFVTYKDEVLPLYRGNQLYEYSPDAIRDIALEGTNWILKYKKEDGRFLYYYDAKEDNFKDHEHPSRPEDNLYYNDLRHCGGIITLVKAYELTNDDKYLKSAKKALDFITSITVEHEFEGETCAYVHYNKKGKLGGTGLAVIAMMKYREASSDKSYDEVIKKYIKHLLSRISPQGEMYGYYIHPGVQDGRPLLNMSDEERRATFSFYYPGEALLGLALFANHFEDDENLVSRVKEKSKIALDWIVDERPKIYSDLFTALPSDGWLMQAIEEWAANPEFRKENYLHFVFNDAKTMMDKMYKKDDSPYIDYEGGNYYNHGDHFYPDGARCEGLIGAYYLAKKINQPELANTILNSCRLAAKSQMILFNTDKNNYAHKNPKKSIGGIRFKPTRQWIRVDSIQHVACFYFRLFSAENL